MKYYKIEINGNEVWSVKNENILSVIEGDIFGQFNITETKVDIENVKICAPIINNYIIAVGANYLAHIKESNSVREAPLDPVLFVKLPTSIIAHNESIILPKDVGRIDYEAEIAVMIGDDLCDADVTTAKNAVFGVTCLNDVSARVIQQQDGQWIRAKNFRTFCPLGPCIETEIDLDNIQVELRQNGVVKQSGNSNMMIFKIPELLSFISKHIPLRKGDIITTGTPEGVGPLQPGDEVEVDIKGVGILRNKVI